MLITFKPEDAKDFNVEGGAGLPKPPQGSYTADIKIVSIETIVNQQNVSKIAVLYEAVKSVNPNLPIGTQFGDYININSTSDMASKIARQTIAKFGYATTGDKDILAKGSYNFLTAIGVTFNAAFVSKETDSGKLDDNGKRIIYKNINFGKVAPLSETGQPAQNNVGYTPEAQPNAQPAWGAPTA